MRPGDEAGGGANTPLRIFELFIFSFGILKVTLLNRFKVIKGKAYSKLIKALSYCLFVFY